MHLLRAYSIHFCQFKFYDKWFNIINGEFSETYQQSVDSHLVGKWCVVNYDDVPYPGVVQNVDDDDIEVQVMHKIGSNRYFWPMMPDILWYKHSQMLCEISEPSKVGTRHYQLSKSDWAKVIKMTDL